MPEPSETQMHAHLPPPPPSLLPSFLPSLNHHSMPPPISPSAHSHRSSRPSLPPPASQSNVGLPPLTSPIQSSPARSLPMPTSGPGFDTSPLPPIRFSRPMPHRRHHTCSHIEYGSHPPQHHQSISGSNPHGFSILPPMTSSAYGHDDRQFRSDMPAPPMSVAPPSEYSMSDDPKASGRPDSGSDDASERTGMAGKKKKKSQRFYCRDFPPCQLSFTRSEHLARHIRKHTGEKPFRCHCGRFFSRLDNLRQHAQTVHVNQEIPPDSLAAFVSRNRTRGSVSGSRSRASTISAGIGPGHSRNLSTSSIASTASTVSTGYGPLESRMSALGIVEGGIGGIAGARPTSDKPYHAHARAVSVNDIPHFQFPPRSSGPPGPPPFTFPPPPDQMAPPPPPPPPQSQAPMPPMHQAPHERRHERDPSYGRPSNFQFPGYYQPQPPPQPQLQSHVRGSQSRHGLELPHPHSDPRDSNPLPGIEALVRPVLERRMMYGHNSGPYADHMMRSHHPPSPPESGRPRDGNPMLAVLME